jgi:hypothetical protein
VPTTPLQPNSFIYCFSLNFHKYQFLTFFTVLVKPWINQKKNPPNYILLLFIKFEFKHHLHQTEKSTYSWAFCITFLKFTILGPQIKNGTTLSISLHLGVSTSIVVVMGLVECLTSLHLGFQIVALCIIDL